MIRYRALQAIARRVGIRPLVPSLLGTLFGKPFLRDPERAAERELWRQQIAGLSLAGALRAVDGVVERAAVVDELAGIRVPTLVIVGEQDAAAPLQLGERIRAGIPGSRLITVPAGHTSPVERPEAITAAIEGLLSDLPGTTEP